MVEENCLSEQQCKLLNDCLVKQLEGIGGNRGQVNVSISQAEELKIDHGVSPRSMRQWKKDVKARHSTFLVDKEKLAKFLNNRQEEIDEEMERKRFEAKQEQQQEEESREKMNLPVIRGSNYLKIQEFYESSSRNLYADNGRSRHAKGARGVHS
ncbi:unnamed protein product [Porites evermanni]|uniref:Uncharacterized protein n=1 Tax=Porites evermanni TaxID=104178 RepID=A0ABN8LZL1_9CNID|nr:unnamed protein product [Porites evermanni]